MWKNPSLLSLTFDLLLMYFFTRLLSINLRVYDVLSQGKNGKLQGLLYKSCEIGLEDG